MEAEKNYEGIFIPIIVLLQAIKTNVGKGVMMLVESTLKSTWKIGSLRVTLEIPMILVRGAWKNDHIQFGLKYMV